MIRAKIGRLWVKAWISVFLLIVLWMFWCWGKGINTTTTRTKYGGSQFQQLFWLIRWQNGSPDIKTERNRCRRLVCNQFTRNERTECNQFLSGRSQKAYLIHFEKTFCSDKWSTSFFVYIFSNWNESCTSRQGFREECRQNCSYHVHGQTWNAVFGEKITNFRSHSPFQSVLQSKISRCYLWMITQWAIPWKIKTPRVSVFWWILRKSDSNCLECCGCNFFTASVDDYNVFGWADIACRTGDVNEW